MREGFGGGTEMTTRDQTRRELKDLAKLASVMPRERPSAPPPSGEQVSGPALPPPQTVAPYTPVSAIVPSVPTPPGHTPLPPTVLPSPPLALLAPSLPPGAAVLTVPPARAPLWRGLWAVGAGAAMAVAMVGGLLLGQALRSHPERAAARPAAQVVRPATPEPPATTAETAAATAAPASGAPSQTASDNVSDAPAVTLRAPRPAHHAGAKGPLQPKAAVAPSAASGGSDSKVAPKAPQSHAAPAHDSLDDLIRKAASGN
jgi:hypothetical protein